MFFKSGDFQDKAREKVEEILNEDMTAKKLLQRQETQWLKERAKELRNEEQENFPLNRTFRNNINVEFWYIR